MLSKLKSPRKSTRHGFTLLEMLVVMALIGLLVGTVAVSMRGHIARSRITTAKLDIAKLNDAVESYNGFHASYPTQDQGLKILTGTEDVATQFIKGHELKDPWGNTYEYLVPGKNDQPFEIISAGPDKQFDTEDDLSSVTLTDE